MSKVISTVFIITDDQHVFFSESLGKKKLLVVFLIYKGFVVEVVIFAFCFLIEWTKKLNFDIMKKHIVVYLHEVPFRVSFFTACLQKIATSNRTSLNKLTV